MSAATPLFPRMLSWRVARQLHLLQNTTKKSNDEHTMRHPIKKAVLLLTVFNIC